ncbi:hypothetical protein RA27_22055 [Ruegeria sp. ANG-R]|uniref:hypothetical protein n=1 Tax=Ruegeria sp. ANG-R TaxID=1577903 RepID=UPI00057F3BF5|nr:hypothetical protein [Ruegeria sp. ANG-R]KIC36442.1 hypothetical protein RA27_22055 [Ruegeria sp. ANG-R]
MNNFVKVPAVLLSVLSGCTETSPEQLKTLYGVSPSGDGSYTATIEVRENHADQQDRFSQNAFNEICAGPATIMSRTVSKQFNKQTTYTQKTWNPAIGQLVQTASFPVNTPHVRMTYKFKCS